MSKQLALAAEGKRIGLIVVLAALLAALAAVGAPMWSGSAHAQSQTPYLCDGLYHVNPDGSLAIADTVTNGNCTPADPATNATGQEDYVVANNVISYNHEVCAVTDGWHGLAPTFLNTTFGPGASTYTYYFDVIGLGAGNTPAAIPVTGGAITNGHNLIPDGFVDDYGVNVVCATWTSVQPGDQTITLNTRVNNTPVLAAAGSSNACPSPSSNDNQNPTHLAGCDPLIKEWNVLTPTTITKTPANSSSTSDPITLSGNIDMGKDGTNGAAQPGSLIFNPATSAYVGQSATYYENVWGTHTPNQGSQTWYLVAGARVTFENTSTGVGGCGLVVIGNGVNSTNTQNTAFLNPVGGWDAGDPNVGNRAIDNNDNNTVTVTSVGVPIPFYFTSPAGADVPCANALGSFSSVKITVAYPGVVGSDKPTFDAETLRVNWTTPAPAVKQVLLAWAGQTVILEHDWRLPAGDDTDLNPVGVCPFQGYGEGGPEAADFKVRYVRQANSPGSFVAGLEAFNVSTDKAEVWVDGVSQESDVPDDPQDSCISRVLYESEDQGEVDISAFVVRVDPGGVETIDQTQYPFVIYYMNLNTVDLTTAHDAATGDLLSKPSHNSSIYTAADWTPSNPWDASADTDSATSNVSQDVLVRGRVTGWFLNSIPSGRAADSANHLPADRWVMPDDWAELAGGSVVAPGTVGAGLRTGYDILQTPSNTGAALLNPLGTVSTVAITTTLAGSGTGYAGSTVVGYPVPASPLLVADASKITANSTSIFVGASGPYLVTNVKAHTGGGFEVTLAGALSAKPATGTVVSVLDGGVPVEGPYSLIDIPGLAGGNNGIAGAALSNIAGGNSATRDTSVPDGTIDWWDAPMPPANISVAIRGTGFIKSVNKANVYYVGTANAKTSQVFTNPYYISNIPASPFLPASIAGGNYLWNSWGPDGPAADGGVASSRANGQQGQGPYAFWSAVIVGGNEMGVGEKLTTAQQNELAAIRADYGDDPSIARDLTIFSDNHGEFMVAANGDFNLDYNGCSDNSLGGGHQCNPGDAVGTGTVTAVADYPMLKKHAPIGSNAATIDWTWGGYKSVTIEKDPAGNTQYAYVVFHAIDRDGFCATSGGAVLLHSALTSQDKNSQTGSAAGLTGSQLETVDFKIDSGDGIILGTNGSTGTLNDGARFATGVNTYSMAAAKAAGQTYFPLDAANAADGQTDECQAWIKVSNSLLGQTNVLTIAHDDEGNIGFDRVLDFQDTQDYTLNFRWTLFTWAGADNIPVGDALAGGADTKNPEGNDISGQVTAIYGWQPDTQKWLGYFPSGVDVPGANDLTVFHTGQAYWIAIKGPGNVTWTITTNVS